LKIYYSLVILSTPVAPVGPVAPMEPVYPIMNVSIIINKKKNKTLFKVEKTIANSIFYFIIKINHVKSYNYYGYDQCFYHLNYGNGYYYTKEFYKLDSVCDFLKNSLLKRRFLDINYIIYDIVYSYFIYNKYYKFSKKNMNKLYFTFNKSITHLKLFNCRDYYKIYSYI